MSRTISLDEFPGPLRDELKRVLCDCATVVLVEDNRAVAEIHPLPKPRTVEELVAVIEALPHLTPEEAEAFGRDIDEARLAAEKLPQRDPWQDS